MVCAAARRARKLVAAAYHQYLTTMLAKVAEQHRIYVAASAVTMTEQQILAMTLPADQGLLVWEQEVMHIQLPTTELPAIILLIIAPATLITAAMPADPVIATSITAT
jgi:hypothetical protein